MKLKSTFAALLISYSGFSQNVNIEWAKLDDPKAPVRNVFQLNGTSFNGLSLEKGGYNRIVSYKNLAFTTTSSFKSVVNGKSTDDIGTVEIGGKIINFSSKDNDDKTAKTIYAHVYNESAVKAEIEGKKIASFFYKMTVEELVNLAVTVSNDKQKACITYYSSISNESKTKKGCYGYFILNSNLEIESKGIIEDKFEELGERIREFKITNKGALVAVSRTHKIQSEIPFLAAYVVSGNELNPLDLKLEDNIVNQLKLIDDKQGNIIVTGFYGARAIYGKEKYNQVKGMFFAKIDPSNEKVLNFGSHELDEKFIVRPKIHGDFDKQDAETRKRNYADILKYFQMKFFEATDDGGFIGVSEEYIALPGPSSYTHHFFDLIVYKFDKDGEFEWEKKILKSQTPILASLSSFAVNQIKGKVFIFFNDDINNYDRATKKYLDLKDPIDMGSEKGSTVIAMVEINSKNGEIKRNAINVDPENRMLASYFFFDNESSFIAVCKTPNSKEVIGRITINE